MLTRILAIGLIWVCAAVAWFALAGTIDYRTRETGERTRSSVEELWGRRHRQEAPAVELRGTTVPLQASEVRVDLDLTHRKKGLQWYPTYRVHFDGAYVVSNPDDEAVEVMLAFALPDANAVYDEFELMVEDAPVETVVLDGGVVRHAVQVNAESDLTFRVAYRSQGMTDWYYAFGPEAKQVRNFTLTMETDFDAIDFPETGTSPTGKEKTPEGWRLSWGYENLLSGVQIGMVMPEKLNPGPWVKMVSAAAPVSLFLFFFVLLIATTLRRIRLHPMNYFFIAAAFFSYHLLLSYLVDHISIHVAFWICSAVSIFLVVSYMRLVVGARMAFVEVGISQFVYLVLFSYTFFFRGFTGLAVTILCIVTLFIVMQATGRLNWNALFRGDHEEPDIAPPPPVVGAES